MPVRTPRTFVDLLRGRASSDPDRVVYTFLQENLDPGFDLSLGHLDVRARAIAAFLQSNTAAGDRILLSYPFGPDFLEGFFGSMYAGRIPVPAYPPRPGRANQAYKAIRA